MKSTIIKTRQKIGLRLYLCTLTFCVASAFAQTELGESPIKPVKRQQVANDKYPTTILHGQVIDQATKLPLAGIQLQTLGNKNYTAMTKEDGTFTIKVPVFTTSLYVHSPQYLSQQVAVNAADADKDIRIVMLADKFAKMYDEETTITARKSLDVSARAQTTIDNEIAMGLSADVRSVLRSADPAGGAAMFIRGYNSLTSNAQPLIVDIDRYQAWALYGYPYRCQYLGRGIACSSIAHHDECHTVP